MEKLKKEDEYARKIIAVVTEMFDEDSECEYKIDDLHEDNNATAFFHALANLAPALIYNRFTKEGVNLLQFNHIANQLIFQKTEREKS